VANNSRKARMEDGRWSMEKKPRRDGSILYPPLSMFVLFFTGKSAGKIPAAAWDLSAG
jgi:hypothetical protein